MSETKTIHDVAILLLQDHLESRRKWVTDSQHEMSGLMDLELRGLDPNLILSGGGSIRDILDSVTRIQPQYQNNIWLWFRLPFQVYRAGIHGHLQSTTSSVLGDERLPETLRKELRHDTDDWILCNEKHLHSLSITQCAVAHQMYGVVWMEDLQQSLFADEICLLTDGTTADEQSIALKVSRSPINSIPGYLVLTERRKSVVFLQPNIQRFRSTWDEITDKVLDGLDWDHIMVAGGMVLATLLCPSIPSEIHDTSNAHTVEEWKSSDLDLYIYGLGLEEANKKIRHVASVY
ncbi:hypothetical protein F5146DRAFT_1141915 [Armillaria mellea]|nr:hypothetical protein F5146DRAFT_1141915 [Armillaria mellea]